MKDIFKDKFTSTIKSVTFDVQVFDGVTEKIIYEDCKFHNITLKKIRFNDILFLNCDFTNCTFEDISLEPLSKTLFDNCSFTMITLKTVDLTDSVSRNCNFNLVTFIDTEFYNARFIYSSFKQVVFKNGCSIENMNIFKPCGWLGIEFDNSVRLIKVNRLTCITNFDYKNRQYGTDKSAMTYSDSVIDTSYPGLKKMCSDAVGETYLNLAHQFRIHNMEDLYGEYYYKGKREIHKNLRFIKKFKSKLAFITCGYGEKWHFGVLTSFAIIIVSAILFMFNGIKLSNEKVINYNIGVNNKIRFWNFIYDFGHSLYFSMMTFTTVGYGNISADSEVSYMVSFLEMYIGVILIAIITGSILRKLFR
jgi:voltage-gated potassium channel Kch